MDYYKLRTIIFQRITTFLETREEALKKKLEPPNFSNFQRKLMIEHGVTKKMIREMVEQLVPGGTIKNDELAKIDD